ncbi:MAG: serine--tRNA ligase [Tepidiformaceae bacterium]
MLSVQYIRENVDRVKGDVILRNSSAPIDQVLQLDDERRVLLQEVERLRAERNVASKEIGASKDAAERDAKIASMRGVSDRITELELKLRTVEASLQQGLYEIPNIVDPQVPRGPDEESNVVIESYGSPKALRFTPKTHWEIGEGLAGIDFERAVKMSGSRFYVLRDGIARLHRALIAWMLDFHTVEGGFIEHYLPYMVSEESLFASGHLPKFRDNLYHDAEEDYYFIPTAEASFANLYRDEILPPGFLPQRFVAHTPCFRREKMSAGRDTRGLKRVHQFEKVEMFVFCEPEQSEAELENLVQRARSIPEQLELPHRVIQLCSGDLDFKATMGFDVEIWSPGIGEWLEVSSASNCLDFQARRANIRYRPAADGPTRYPHMLNASGLAPGRTLIAVLENYQEEDGSVVVPEVLRRYVGADVLSPQG